jgi:hypothetical protein
MRYDPEPEPFTLNKADKATRRLVETVYAQLTERFHVLKMSVRDAWHLQKLRNTKILAHTVCVFFNITHQRNPPDFEGLVTF